MSIFRKHGIRVGLLCAGIFLIWAEAAAAAGGWNVGPRPSREAQPVEKGQIIPHYKAAAVDPVGDTFGAGAVQLDLTQLSATIAGDNLVVGLSFTAPVSEPDSGEANAIDGFIDLDLDQDGATGDLPWTDFLRGDGGSTGMGNEAYVDLFSFDSATGMAEIIDEATEQVIGMAGLAVNGSSVTVTVPLAVLADADNAMDVAAVVGTFDEPTDVAPNQGSVTTSADASVFLLDGRFRVEVEWADFDGNQGEGRLVNQSTDSAVLYFFSPQNWEVLLKVLDGCFNNDHYWVFFAATTNVEFSLTVTDLSTGDQRVYNNELGQSADAVNDTMAFPNCP